MEIWQIIIIIIVIVIFFIGSKSSYPKTSYKFSGKSNPHFWLQIVFWLTVAGIIFANL